MAPWKEGDDYAFWRVNVLANNLTNSRYFNYNLVDSIKPDPIEKPLELPPDLQALVDEQNIDVDESNLLSPEQRQLAKARQLATSNKEVTQNVVDENSLPEHKMQNRQSLKLRCCKAPQLSMMNRKLNRIIYKLKHVKQKEFQLL